MADTRLDSLGGATPMSRMSPEGRLEKPAPAPGPLLASPAGGMFSTPSDLSRLLAALFGGRLLSKATLAALVTARADPSGGPGGWLGEAAGFRFTRLGGWPGAGQSGRRQAFSAARCGVLPRIIAHRGIRTGH
jgi:CubicO group peptidase (beta-lactamase class C family)